MKSQHMPQFPEVGEGKRGETGHIAYLLRQANGAVRAVLDQAFEATGLTTPQFLVLNLLNAYPGASGAELSRIAQLTPQTVNLVVRKLDDDGLVERVAHETHGRVLRLRLTAQGRSRLKKCRALADEVEARMLSVLDPASEKIVREWLIALAKGLSGAGQAS